MLIHRRERARKIGELCLDGDWAAANGDLEALGSIAESLAGLAEEPLHCELQLVAERCRRDPAAAVAAWMELKDRLR